MIYREHEPNAALRGHVQCLWELQGPCDEAAPRLIVPDGCVALVLNFGGPLEQLLEVGQATPRPRTLVIGEVQRPIAIQSNGHVRLLGVRFWPGGARPFLDTSIAHVLGGIRDESCLGRTLSRHIAQNVHSAAPTDRMSLLQAALTRQVQTAKRSENAIVRSAVTALVAKEGRVRIDGLAAQLGLSRRSFERQFAEQVGMPAKSLANVLRFRRALRTIQTCGASWAEICVDSGYYDQSHFIRDFKRFTGLTPNAYRAEQNSLAALRIAATRNG